MKYRMIVNRIVTMLLIIMLLMGHSTVSFATKDSFSNDEFSFSLNDLDDLEVPLFLSEDTTKRESNVKHFLLSDHSFVAVVYDEPVHYMKGNKWVEIDNTMLETVLIGNPFTGIVERKSSEMPICEREINVETEGNNNNTYHCYIENANNIFKVQMPVEISKDLPIVVNCQDNTLRFVFDAVQKSSAMIDQPPDSCTIEKELADKLAVLDDPTEKIKLKNEYATLVEKNSSAIRYSSVLKDVDLNYRLSGESLKETITMHRLPLETTFSFSFYTTLKAHLEKNNSLSFYDDKGCVAFVIPAPYMFDSANEFSNNVQIILEEIENGFRYTLVPDEEWMKDPQRVFPLMIDPTIENIEPTTQVSSYIHDNGVQQSDPNTNYITTNRIYVGSGTGNKEGRMYFKLTQWPSNQFITSNSITAATMKLWYYPQSSYQTASNLIIKAYRVLSPWDTNTITWNTQTGISGTLVSTSSAISAVGTVPTNPVELDVTSWVQYHYGSPSTDYGIRFQPQTVTSSTNRACFISSDYSTGTDYQNKHPLILIYYNAPAGVAPGITNNGVYYLRNVNSGKYLDLPSGNSTNGTDLIQYHFGGTTNQQFRVSYNASTHDYSLSPVCATSSAIEITNESSSNNAIVQIWKKPSTGLLNSQRFSITQNLDGTYSILSYASNYTKAVAVINSSTTNNAAIVQYAENGSASQKWFFEPANKIVTTNSQSSVNSIYVRDYAGQYAITYGPSPNTAYNYFGEDGGDCTNFVSQCLYAAHLPMLPDDAVWGLTNKTATENWFYILGVFGLDWYTTSFTSATAFNEHWAQNSMRAYQTIEYASGAEALEDIEFLLWYLKEGDVIQLKNSSGGYYHSMIVCNDDTFCNGSHKGVSGTCPNYGKKEIIYAQHTSNFNNGHLRALLADAGLNSGIVFIKIKKDF